MSNLLLTLNYLFIYFYKVYSLSTFPKVLPSNKQSATTIWNNLLPVISCKVTHCGGETGDFPAIQPLHSRIQLNRMNTVDKLYWNNASGSDLATVKRQGIIAHIPCRPWRSWWYQVPWLNLKLLSMDNMNKYCFSLIRNKWHVNHSNLETKLKNKWKAYSGYIHRPLC